ncbi:transposase [Streptomyces rhizosphaericus]|uniref:transposase n=1 Tax=Streptomyces rhizosphaericus TaxID=114699 RepID=UPI001BAAD8DE
MLGDGHPRLSVLFPRKACRECDDRLKCTGNIDGKGRHIFLLTEPQQKIQTQVRKDQKTSNWQRRYAVRAGCEATVSETVHAHGLRHCRYRGLAKTHVQHVPTAAGANIIRLSEHFPPGITPASPPRPPSHFQQLCPGSPPRDHQQHPEDEPEPLNVNKARWVKVSGPSGRRPSARRGPRAAGKRGEGAGPS